MTECVRVYARYDIPDAKGNTRRERNTRVGVESPEFEIPEYGLHIWGWFTDLTSCIYRVSDGYYHVINPSEYLAWSQLTGNNITSFDYDVLRSMDLVFCQELNKDIKAEYDKKVDQTNIKKVK